MRDFKKITSVIVALIIVITMFFSVAFISCNAHHDCTGENCPVCEMIQMAENVLSKLSMAIVIIAIALFMCILAQRSMAVLSNVISFYTPIKLKVKMLN